MDTLNSPFASSVSSVCAVCSGSCAQLCSACTATKEQGNRDFWLHRLLPSPHIRLMLFILARHFSWGKLGCTFPVSDGEQCIFSLIYYTASPSSCSLVAELQVNKMIAITESPVVCAALDFSIMSHHYDLGEACFA